MSFIKEFIKLTRFEHALMLAIAVLLSEIIVLGSIPSFSMIILFSLLVPILSEMGSFALNDYLDIEADKMNKRNERPLVKGTISPNFAFYFSWISLLLSLVLSYFINFPAFIIVLIFNVLAILYNYKLKDLPLVGNIYIALSMVIPLIFGNFVVSGELNSFVILLSILAFFSGLGREVIKSVQDMEGDKKARKSLTFPLWIGKRKAIVFASICYLIFVIFTGLLVLDLTNIISIALVVLIALFFLYQVFYLLFKKENKEFLEYSRKYSLLALFLGLLSVLIEILF